MKKVLFVLPHMLCGGVEKALLSLINEMPKKEVEITILMVKAEGEFIKLIPPHVTSGEVPLPEYCREELMFGGIKASARHYLQKGQIVKFIKLIQNILRKDPLATLMCDFSELKNIEGVYDTAICFHMHMPFIVRYVAEKVDSKKKIAWIHNDFENSGYNIKPLENYLNYYQHFFAVSEQLRDEFGSIFPEYKKITSVAHNIISEQYIQTCADEYMPEEFDPNYTGIKILSIGRLDKQKGFDTAICVAKKLRESDIDFKWYILGNGVEEKSLKKSIKKNNLVDCFILLGIRTNPYPYLKNCDLYVQPSRHEGYGIAVAEARVLHKAIICTDFAGAREQIESGTTGLVVPFDINELFNAILLLIRNPNIRQRFERNLSLFPQSNYHEVDSILKVLL